MQSKMTDSFGTTTWLKLEKIVMLYMFHVKGQFGMKNMMLKKFLRNIVLNRYKIDDKDWFDNAFPIFEEVSYFYNRLVRFSDRLSYIKFIINMLSKI